MKSIKELAGNKRFAILGNRTMAENYEWWMDRCRRDANIGGKNHVAPPPRDDEFPPEANTDAEKLHAHLERSGVPDRIAEVLRTGLQPTDAVESVKHWWGFGKSFMLLHGTSGKGKSVAAASAFLKMRRVTRWDGGSHEEWDSVGCAFETAAELARFGYFSDDAHRLLKHLGKVTCLVLDDLGVEMMSESWRATLDSLLAERFGRTYCRTILTTNLSCKKSRDKPNEPSAFEERYGARLARRIRESGSVVAVESREERAGE